MYRGNVRFLPHNTVYKGRAWSVAIYVRLSDEDRNKRRKTDPSQSIENQVEYLRNYVEILNGNSEDGYALEIYKEYSDDDCTGMNFDRGGFRQMMLDIRSGWVDCIMVKTLSRLGRNDREMQQYLKEEFEQNGQEVRVCAVGDAYDSLYQDPMDMGVQFKLMMNENYSQTQHTNVTIGMHTMQKSSGRTSWYKQWRAAGRKPVRGAGTAVLLLMGIRKIRQISTILSKMRGRQLS